MKNVMHKYNTVYIYKLICTDLTALLELNHSLIIDLTFNSGQALLLELKETFHFSNMSNSNRHNLMIKSWHL